MRGVPDCPKDRALVKKIGRALPPFRGRGAQIIRIVNLAF